MLETIEYRLRKAPAPNKGWLALVVVGLMDTRSVGELHPRQSDARAACKAHAAKRNARAAIIVD